MAATSRSFMGLFQPTSSIHPMDPYHNARSPFMTLFNPAMSILTGRDQKFPRPSGRQKTRAPPPSLI